MSPPTFASTPHHTGIGGRERARSERDCSRHTSYGAAQRRQHAADVHGAKLRDFLPDLPSDAMIATAFPLRRDSPRPRSTALYLYAPEKELSVMAKMTRALAVSGLVVAATWGQFTTSSPTNMTRALAPSATK